MDKRIMLIVILVFLIAGMGFAFENEPDGFRGLKWSDSPTEDMEYIFESKATGKAYVRPADKMSIGNAQFYMIGYGFYGKPERFFSVSCFFRGEENYDLLKIICEGKFGEATEEGWLYELIWQGQGSCIILDYDLIEEEGYLTLASSMIMIEKAKAEELEEIAEAEGDF